MGGITALLSAGKLMLCLWSVCLALTLNCAELEGMIDGTLEMVSSYNKRSNRIIAGTIWFLLLTPAFCVRFACHQIYRILTGSKSPDYADTGAETDVIDSASSPEFEPESKSDSAVKED